MSILSIFFFADEDGVHLTVDVGECVDICRDWVSGFGGLEVRVLCECECVRGWKY